MQFSLYYLFTLIAAYSFREGQGAVNFTKPLSGSVISNFEGALNGTTITCTITRDSPAGSQITTQWNVGNFRGNGENLVDIAQAPELFSVGGDPIPGTNFLFDNELTILNWAAELDGVIVYCGTGLAPQQASFTLRIYRPPNLHDNFLVMVEENTINTAIDLRQAPAAFPEPTIFTWRKNGQLLIRFDQTFSNVTIPSVQRVDTGNYSVFATNFVLDGSLEQVGNDSGSFYLDVIYGPSFQFDGPQQMPTPAYVLLGNPLSLVCGRGLHSNPEASIRWLDTNGTAIMDNAHYDLENGTAIVRLNFTRTIASDNGMWTCEVVVRSERYIVDSEGELVRGGLAVIGNILRHRFIVTVIAPPGQPRSLGLENVGATWVRICWEPPFDVDFPISRYEIIARPLDNVDAKVVNTSTRDNRTFINITNLDPGILYNFSVVAVIEAGGVVARGVESESLGDIMTATTVPEMVCPRPESQNGVIIVSWSFVHTGGLPLTNISITYGFQQDLLRNVLIPVPGGISARSVMVPNLVAGVVYIFNITAENTNGSSTVQCEGILHELGVPATPEFGILTMGGRGEIIIQLKTVASGINSHDQDFNFIIIPVLSGIEQTERIFAFPAYMSGEFVSITVNELQLGANYTFSATAMNIFGTSGSANSPAQFAGGDSPSSNPQPAPGSESVNVESAVIGGVLGSFLIIAALIIIVLMILLIKKNQNNTATSTLSRSGATKEAVYEYPDMFQTSTDLNMESCAAYGVVST